MRRPSPVNGDSGAGNEAGRVAGQKNSQSTDFVQVPPASERDPGDKLPVFLRVLLQSQIHLGGKGAQAASH